MEIKRKASARNERAMSIRMEAAGIASAPDGTITISERYVLDFYGKSQHNYTLSISPLEIVKMMSALAAATRATGGTVGKSLAPALKDFLVVVQAVTNA